MMNSKDTKKALLGSLLSMIVCLAMLVGSTFAWFSDSVVSGTNKIVAGNLDVQLWHKNAKQTTLEEVTTTTPLFVKKDGLLVDWEPGVMVYENFTVKNVGSLALKYKLKVNVGDHNFVKDGETATTKSLKDVLKVALVEKHLENPTRDSIIQDTEISFDMMADSYSKEFELEAGAKGLEGKKYAMVIYWEPSAVDNEYNINNGKKVTDPRDGKEALYIDLGVELNATQHTVENDSFDDQYDMNAWLDMTLTDNTNGTYSDDAGNLYVKHGENYVPVTKSDTTKDLYVAENGDKYVAKDNAFEKEAPKGGNVVLIDDISLGYDAVKITNNGTIDLNGRTLKGPYTASNKKMHALTVSDADVTIKNGTIVDVPINYTQANALLFVEGNSNVNVENCELKTKTNKTFAICTYALDSQESTIVVKDSIVSGPTAPGTKGYALFASAGNITFENCDVTGHIFISGGDITFDGGTYTATGFNNQSKIWHVNDTATYVSGTVSGDAFTMGDSILIADRRDDFYNLTGVTIRNVKFNTEITLKDGSKDSVYAIKYVDMNKKPGADRINCVVENNTYSNKINGKDPVMFIDLNGNDISK